MKKNIIYILSFIYVGLFLGCSNDTDAPTFSKYKVVSKPDSVLATYYKSTDKVKISWVMKDTSGVTDFIIAISDSSDFDKGKVKEIARNDTTKASWIQPYSYTWDPATFKSTRDSVRIYFVKIAAIYNTSKLNNFIGPKSLADSTLVRK